MAKNGNNAIFESKKYLDVKDKWSCNMLPSLLISVCYIFNMSFLSYMDGIPGEVKLILESWPLQKTRSRAMYTPKHVHAKQTDPIKLLETALRQTCLFQPN